MKNSPPETSYFPEMMNLLMFIIGNMFSLLNKITSHYNMWFLLLLALAISSQAAPTPSSDIEMGNGNQTINVLSPLNNRWKMPALSPTPQRNSRMKITMYWIRIVPFSQSQTLSSVSKMCELPNYPWSTLKCRINTAAANKTNVEFLQTNSQEVYRIPRWQTC